MQRNSSIMSQFKNYSERQFIDSIVASKLNGFNKKGKLSDFANEINDYGLEEDLKENVLEFIKNNS